MVRTRTVGCRVQGFAAIAILFIVAAPHMARAQETAQQSEVAQSVDATTVPAVEAVPAAQVPLSARIDHLRTQFTAWRKDAGPMLPLYSGFAALQVLDVQSTTRAIASGAT